MTSERFGNIDLRAGFTRLHRLKLSLGPQDPRESAIGLPYVRFFSDMSGILVAKYASGRNVKKCFNVPVF